MSKLCTLGSDYPYEVPSRIQTPVFSLKDPNSSSHLMEPSGPVLGHPGGDVYEVTSKVGLSSVLDLIPSVIVLPQN